MMMLHALMYRIVTLALICCIHGGCTASLLDTYRGWSGVDVIEQRRVREEALWVNQSVTNVFQCMRLCWLFRACNVATFALGQQWCGLYKEKYTTVKRHELGNLHLIPNADSTVLGMLRAVFSKTKVQRNMKNRGCDDRPCSESEMCTPVRNQNGFVCLPLASLYCSHDPPTVTNGKSNSDGVGSVVYTCAEYYRSTGTSFISNCDRSKRRWSPVDMTCNLVDCGAPPTVEGTTSKILSTFYGGKVVYKCLDGGASSSSSMSVTCQANGQWSDPPEACVFRSCGHPPAVLHALPKLLKRPTGNTFPATSVIQLSLAVGGIIQYPCKPGYTSRFEASYASECQTDGTWSSTHYISCTPLDCGNPPFLPNTYRQATPFSSNLQDTTAQIGGTTAPLSTTFESVMYYSCHAGYSFGLSDSFAIGTHNPRLALICGVNGTWDFAPGSISNINMSAGCVQLQVQ